MLDINTVSAGGGTIARVDAARRTPGRPATARVRCPGRRRTATAGTARDRHRRRRRPRLPRTRPTSSTASSAVDAAAAHDVVRARSPSRWAWTRCGAADGIVRVVNVKMAQAIKAISTERGFDLRDFTLVAFGGAGPVHATQIALDLGIPRVLVPSAPGANSALGLLMSDVKHDYVRSRLGRHRRARPRRRRRALRAISSGPRPNSSRPRASSATRSGSAGSSTCATPVRATRTRCRSAGSRSRRRGCTATASTSTSSTRTATVTPPPTRPSRS